MSAEPGNDISKLTKIQKLAILLIILGPDAAAQVLKNLDEHELEAVSAEMSHQTFISQKMQADILKEFSEVALIASTSVRGGLDVTQAILEKAVGSFKASHVINRFSPSPAPTPAMQRLLDLDSRQILHLIRQEQPQTIALITSYLPPEKASQVLEMLKDDQRSLVIERLATLDVEIPPGIHDGQQIRLSGEGHAGDLGGPAGDVYVQVRVKPHPQLVREGNDLFCTVDLTMTEAALGASVRIPTLDGEEQLELEPGTQPGRLHVLRGKGMPVLQGFGRGDQRVLVNVQVPRRLTEEQRRLLEDFEQSASDETYEADEGFFQKLKSAFR